MSEYQRVSHVIFDMDGLILDTERLYTEVTKKFLVPYDKEFSYEIKSKVMGRPRNEATKLMMELYGIQLSVQEAKDKFLVLYKEVFPHTQLLPGVERLIRHLHQHRIPMAVATGSDREVLQLKTQNHGELFDLFDHIVTSDDPRVTKGKPSPDAFLVTLADFDAPPRPEQVLVLEDSKLGVIGAHAAGMPSVWVPNHWDDMTSPPPATLTLKSLADFDPTLFGLPSFDHDNDCV